VVLEDHGYDVRFIKGKVFLRNIAMGQVKQIGVQVKNLYALEVQDACKALRRRKRLETWWLRGSMNYLSIGSLISSLNKF